MAAKKQTRKPRKKSTKKMADMPKVEVRKDPSKKPVYKKPLFLAGTLVVIVIAGFLVRKYAIAAMVNGRPIWRTAVIKNLEQRQGAEALDSLITEKLVMDEAANQGVEVTQQDIEESISKLQDSLSGQGQDLDTLLAAEGISRDELEHQIRLQVAIEKLLTQKISISDEEVAEYIETYKDSFLQGVAEDQLDSQARDQLTQQRMSEEFNTWIEDLKTAANIHYYIEY